MVLQRWQTVYLLVAAILMAVFAFFPAIEIVTPQAVYAIGATTCSASTCVSQPDVLLLILNVLIVVMALITTFSYRNLKRQMRLCSITAAITLALVITIGLLAYRYRDVAEVTITAFNIMPVIAFVCLLMAHRGMASDKKLLSESDRLR
ncbi:MAG: DUF4293 domain-containing protein [Muribaculaceae bacterium]|jgi:hypothetical protein|nr:DUF4293 domain-containing protein [Muribaculaceae bacterium]MBQ2236467.1 DUF4293 domain-containing protein [Muribaculaceae bacterium]MBQ2484795.1 DUF4293 domain-containing protein [Muribaculaceae bacterium]MBQ4139129.1 DUF4293 domain-containing protein [Muribaculaceae bacterium]